MINVYWLAMNTSEKDPLPSPLLLSQIRYPCRLERLLGLRREEGISRLGNKIGKSEGRRKFRGK